MAIEYKVLGQSAPSATTNTNVYSVPSGKQAVISTITVANRGSSTAAYRLAVRPNNETLADKHYIAYDTAVGSLDTVTLTIGMTLGADDVVSVASFDAHNVSFTLFGSEVT